MPALATIQMLLSHYGYLLLLPLAIIEGPIVTIIAAFLASQGVLNVYIVYVIAILGDVIGDAIYYWIGRAGRDTLVSKYGKYIGLTEARIQFAEEHYSNHLWKTLIFGKITQAPIMLVIVAAGASRVNFKKFMLAIFVITLPKALFFTLIGFYAGKSFSAIGHGLDVSILWGWGVIAVFLLAFLLRRRFMKSAK